MEPLSVHSKPESKILFLVGFFLVFAIIFFGLVFDWSYSRDMFDLLWGIFVVALVLLITIYGVSRGNNTRMLIVRIDASSIWYAGLKVPLPWSIIKSASVVEEVTVRGPNLYYLAVETMVPVDGYGRVTHAQLPSTLPKESFWPNRKEERKRARIDLRRLLEGFHEADSAFDTINTTIAGYMGSRYEPFNATRSFWRYPYRRKQIIRWTIIALSPLVIFFLLIVLVVVAD